MFDAPLRNLRTDDSDLHVSCLPEITNNIFCNGSYELCEMACEIL